MADNSHLPPAAAAEQAAAAVLAALKTTAYISAATAGRAYLKRFAADAAKRASAQPTGRR